MQHSSVCHPMALLDRNMLKNKNARMTLCHTDIANYMSVRQDNCFFALSGRTSLYRSVFFNELKN